MSQHYVLAIDQGTTSSRAILFDRDGRNVGSGQKELAQHFPKDGWVEHDPEDIWRDVVAVCRQAIAAAGVSPSEIAAIGITNQRETTVLWERGTGTAVHRAIVWQDRRTAEHCRRLVADGLEEHVRARTGLVVDAYFSGTKLAWLLDNVPGARAAAEHGALAFGTDRQLPALAADRRARPCDGRHQRLAHHAVRHRRSALGPAHAGGAARSRSRAARGARLLGRVRHHRPRAVRGRDPDHWASRATSRRPPWVRPVSSPA